MTALASKSRKLSSHFLSISTLEMRKALRKELSQRITKENSLVSTGDIHVEGAIHGNITCRALTLSGQPVIKGSVKVETVRIYGTFDGNIQAKKVALTKAARMNGDISYGTSSLEPGAQFEGTVSRTKGT